MATEHRIIPAIPTPLLPLALAVPIMLKISPTIAKGILSQFSHPRKGKKKRNIPIMLRIPKIKPRTCILTLLPMA